MSSKSPAAQSVSPDAAISQVKQLVEQLHLATSAVARNSVEEMEHCLWQQEMLCAALKRTMVQLLPASHHAPTHEALRTATVVLGRTNRTYGELVQQGRRSVAPLLELCQLYRSAPSATPDSLFTPLSCEV